MKCLPSCSNVTSRFAVLIFFWLLLPFAHFFTAPGVAQVRPRVINGSNVAPGTYPWMTALLRESSDDTTEAHFCGGALVGPTLVMTAAHCAAGFESNPQALEVSVGEVKLPFGRGVRIPVAGVLIHPDFNRITLEHDVAFLRLGRALSGPYLAPALAGNESLYAAGTEGRAIGWGQTDPQLPILPTILQQGIVPIQSQDTCSQALGRYFKPDSQMCAGRLSSSTSQSDGVDACFGDSGGPLIVANGAGNWLQVGIVSWGFGCATATTYGVYSKVLANTPFISTPPVFRPVAQDTPQVTGSASIGSLLTCVPGTFLGDPYDALSYKWYRGYDYDQIPGATQPTYQVVNADQLNVVRCSVVASNAGGSSDETYADAVSIPSSPPSSTPTPAPIPIVNLGAPTAEPFDFRCKAGRCRLLVAVGDPDGASDVRSVGASVSYTYKSFCSVKGSRSTVPCQRTRTRLVDGKRLVGDVWEILFKYTNGSTRFLTASLLVIDSVGQSPRTVTTVSKKFRIK